MFCSCRISTDKCLARSLCNSRASCYLKGAIERKLAYPANYLRKPIFTKFSEIVDICVIMINLSFVFPLFKGRCHGNQISIWAKSEKLTGLSHLHLSHWHFEMDYRIAMTIVALAAAMIALHLLEIWWAIVQWLWSLRGLTVYSRRRSALEFI